jgi:hypothetical protein
MLEIMTDDEALREQGMTDGPKKIGKFKLRPMTALSLSWLQRNNVFSDDTGDSMQKTAAFVFLHTEPKESIRSVVNNKSDFANAIDDWIDSNIRHHADLEPYTTEMSKCMEVYLASVTHAVNPSPDSPQSKN